MKRSSRTVARYRGGGGSPYQKKAGTFICLPSRHTHTHGHLDKKHTSINLHQCVNSTKRHTQAATGEWQAPFTHTSPCPPTVQLPWWWIPLASNKMSGGLAHVTHQHTHTHTIQLMDTRVGWNVRGPCPVMYLMESGGKCQLFLKMAAEAAGWATGDTRIQTHTSMSGWCGGVQRWQNTKTTRNYKWLKMSFSSNIFTWLNILI